LPRFVEDEFRAFLTCGAMAHGCARLRCESCGLDRLIHVTLVGWLFLLREHFSLGEAARARPSGDGQ